MQTVLLALTDSLSGAARVFDISVTSWLGLRILHLFFVRLESLSLDAFAGLLTRSGCTGLSADNAIAACLLAAYRKSGCKRAPLLLVDGVLVGQLQGGDQAANERLARILGRLLDVFPPAQLKIVGSAVTAGCFSRHECVMGRRRVWASLPTLPVEGATAVIRRALSEAAKSRGRRHLEAAAAIASPASGGLRLPLSLAVTVLPALLRHLAELSLNSIE